MNKHKKFTKIITSKTHGDIVITVEKTYHEGWDANVKCLGFRMVMPIDQELHFTKVDGFTSCDGVVKAFNKLDDSVADLIAILVNSKIMMDVHIENQKAVCPGSATKSEANE